MQETWVQSLGQEDPLVEGMTTYSSILAWKNSMDRGAWWVTVRPMGSVMPSNHLILCCPLLLLPSIFPSIRVFSNELALCIRWPKYWASVSASVFPNIQGWFPLGLTDLVSLQFKWLSRVFSSTIIQKHQFFSSQPSLWSNSCICTWLLQKP